MLRLLLLCLLPLVGLACDARGPGERSRFGRSGAPAGSPTVATEDASPGGPVQRTPDQTVALERLRSVLPATLASLGRESIDATTQRLLDFEYNQVEAGYRAGTVTATCQITDGVNAAHLVASLAPFRHRSIDSSLADGSYRRTLSLSGHPALEEYDAEAEGTGGLAVILLDRYVISLRSNGLAEGSLRAVFTELDLSLLPR